MASGAKSFVAVLLISTVAAATANHCADEGMGGECLMESREATVLLQVKQEVATKDVEVHEIAKLTASGSSNSFGRQVERSGNTILVGDTMENYIFTTCGADWQLQGKFSASGGERLGEASALFENTALVVGRCSAADTYYQPNCAYIFETWGGKQVVKLMASDAKNGTISGFGNYVAASLSKTQALIGDWKATVEGVSVGAAYVFSQGENGWSQTQKLQPSDAMGSNGFHQGLNFGSSVGLSGNTALVGALEGQGAYIFKNNDDSWSQVAKLTASDAHPDDFFGYAGSFYGNTALVGAYANKHEESNQMSVGSAYIFKSGDDGVWSQQAKLLPNNFEKDDMFGYRVSMSATGALVSAPGQGAVYLFREAEDGTGWSQVAKLTASDGGSGFGEKDVDLHDNFALVGATNATYLFSLP